MLFVVCNRHDLSSLGEGEGEGRSGTGTSC